LAIISSETCGRGPAHSHGSPASPNWVVLHVSKLVTC